MDELNRSNRVEFRTVQQAPSASTALAGFDELGEPGAEVRRKSPSTRINVPLLRHDSVPASQLLNAFTQAYPSKAPQLRRRIFRALWVDGADISNPDLPNNFLTGLGIEPPAIEA